MPRNEMHEKAGEELPVKFRLVDEIKPSPSGKPRIVVSELTESDLTGFEILR